jgi:hypothetical protein
METCVLAIMVTRPLGKSKGEMQQSEACSLVRNRSMAKLGT